MEQGPFKNLEEMIEQYNREIMKFKALSIPTFHSPPEEKVPEPLEEIPLSSAPEQYPQEIDMITPVEAKEPSILEEPADPAENSAPTPPPPKTAPGFLCVRAFTGGGALPVAHADVIIFCTGPQGDSLLWFLQTDGNGQTAPVALPAPACSDALPDAVPFSCYSVRVIHPQFQPVCIRMLPIFAGITSELPVNLVPCPQPGIGKAPGVEVSIPPFPFFPEQGIEHSERKEW